MDVRLSWTIVLIPLLIWLPLLKIDDVEWYVSLGLSAVWTVAIYTAVWLHEMGHIWAGRRYGIPTRTMTLRALGGLAHLDSPAPHARAEILIALAGPATHVIWAAVVYPLYWVLEAKGVSTHGLFMWNLKWFAELQLLMIGFNLLPIYPFDGGRVLRGILVLKTRRHANQCSMWTAQVGFGGAVMLGLVGLGLTFSLSGSGGRGEFSIFLVWLAIENFMACRRLMNEARWGEGPYEHQEAWKRGGQPDPWEDSLHESKRITEAEEKREAKVQKAREKERLDRDRLQQRVDELLDRINEVGGIDKLSSAERKELKNASERLREEPTG